jgi:hypothetical protein
VTDMGLMTDVESLTVILFPERSRKKDQSVVLFCNSTDIPL